MEAEKGTFLFKGRRSGTEPGGANKVGRVGLVLRTAQAARGRGFSFFVETRTLFAMTTSTPLSAVSIRSREGGKGDIPTKREKRG